MNILKNTAKVALTCLVVSSIAWGYLALHEQDEPSVVSTANADVSFFNFAAQSKHERFLDTLKEEGFEEPREYDWNGNKFYFTLKHSSDEPIDMMRQMQRAFVRNKVNQKAHLFKPTPFNAGFMGEPGNLEAMLRSKTTKKFDEKQRKHIYSAIEKTDSLTDYFNGGIVPYDVQDSFVGMRGIQLKEQEKNKDKSIGEVFKHMASTIKNGKKIDDQVSRFYNMEAFRTKGGGKTTMTAVWSQKDLDMSKYKSETNARLEANHDIPSCTGCVRTMDFSGQGVESSYANNMFMSKNSTPAESQRFYSIELARKGWKQSEATHLLQELHRKGQIPVGANVQSYAKGKEFITVVSHPSDTYANTTVVQVLESL